MRDSRYDAIIAKTTAMASGVNRYRAAPVSSSTGTNTMQMDSVATKAGTAICDAPSSTARTSGLRIAMLRCVFSISTVASSTRMPTASARPPSVITLIVWPSRLRMQSDVRIESGIEMQTISVLRQLPRNSRIIRPVRPAAISASRTTPCDRGAHEDRLVGERASPSAPAERWPESCGSAAFTALTIDSVEALPLRVMVISTPREPLVRTMLVCTWKPSRTCATSLM